MAAFAPRPLVGELFGVNNETGIVTRTENTQKQNEGSHQKNIFFAFFLNWDQILEQFLERDHLRIMCTFRSFTHSKLSYELNNIDLVEQIIFRIFGV